MISSGGRDNVKTWMAGLALALGAVAFLPGGAPAQASRGGAKVKITAPTNGVTVTTPVKITLTASGVEIVPATGERPGTGHHHLFVDHDLTPLTDTTPIGSTGLLYLGPRPAAFALASPKPAPHTVIALW